MARPNAGRGSSAPPCVHRLRHQRPKEGPAALPGSIDFPCCRRIGPYEQLRPPPTSRADQVTAGGPPICRVDVCTGMPRVRTVHPGGDSTRVSSERQGPEGRSLSALTKTSHCLAMLITVSSSLNLTAVLKRRPRFGTAIRARHTRRNHAC